MRLLVIANCQGAPLGKILELWFGGVSIQHVVAHQTGPRQRQISEALLDEQYDAVLTQAISDTFPLECIRTTGVKDRFKGKTFVWPVAYFRGYNPELQYLRGGGKHTQGPLGDYHVGTLIEAFKRGETVQQAADLLADEDYNRKTYASVAAESLAQLQAREQSLDVSVHSFIQEHFAKQRLFYSFNHPANRVLFEIARQLAAKIGLKQRYPFQAGLIGEMLNHIRPPVNPCLRGQLAEASARRVYVGIAEQDGVYVGSGRTNARLYTDFELAQAFYALYR